MNPMNGHPTPPEQPPQVQLAPVPTVTNVAHVDTPSGAFVILQVVTPVGLAGYFLSPAHARTLAQQLHQFAAAAASGLQIVGNLGEPDQDGTA